MCGIFGAAGPGFRSEDFNPEPAFSKLAHRGPDGSGFWRGRGVALGHLRLAVIDLSEKAAQPMTTGDGSVALCFNGEIYNFEPLREELQDLGWSFNSHGDTEVILKGYCEWGEGVFPRLNGMFAVAIFDSRKDKLLLARDHAGIKPLYYSIDQARTIYFASEIKGLPDQLRSSVDSDRLGEQLYFGSIHGSRTLLRGVFKVAPGSVLQVDLRTGASSEARYWTLPTPQKVPAQRGTSKPRTLENLKEILVAAVGRNLVSDRPVGVFLSGGIDSSAIAAISAQHFGRHLEMFTARFGRASDETDIRLAQKLCKEIGCRHHVVDIDDQINIRHVDALLDQFDGPFGDAACVPLTLLAEALPRQMKVILQGDGGDELFGGYPRYRYLRLREKIGVAGALAHIVRRATESSKWVSRRWRRILLALSDPDDFMALARLLSVEFPEDLLAPEKIVHANVPKWGNPYASHREIFSRLENFHATNLIDQALALDFHGILPDIFLEKVDRATMAASIEVRVPLLDRELVEFAAKLNADMKMPHGRVKWLLREALAEFVPDFILREKKRGFGVPYGEWIRSSLYGHVREEIVACPYFKVEVTTRMLDAHMAHREDHSFILWKLFLFARWIRRMENQL